MDMIPRQLISYSQIFRYLRIHPLWKNKSILGNLLTISHNIVFEKFLLLKRNPKYNNLDVHWGTTTFCILQDDENRTQILNFATFRKANRIERMKLRRPDIYVKIKKISRVFGCVFNKDIYYNKLFLTVKKDLVKLIRNKISFLGKTRN